MSKKKQTVSATPQGIKRAENALKRLHGTQLNLAMKLEGLVGRSTIQKFFKGEKILVDKFQEICKALTLESHWEAIAGLVDLPEPVVDLPSVPSPELEQDNSVDVSALVQEVREKIKPYIKERCGTTRVLDMTQPIELTGERGIYTNVNILDKITGRRRLAVAELLQNCTTADEFDRFGLSYVKEERVPGLQAVEKYNKLMVLGKPGAGKTTFLKYLAMQCIEGLFQTSQVPWFITLKDFAEADKQPTILEYIAQQLSSYGVTSADTKISQLLTQGKAFILLDGLDEVREEDTKRVLQQIQDFSNQFYTNQFVITCRIAAKEYTFEQFTEVEVADFDNEQIEIFVTKWFQQKKDEDASGRFMQQLESNEQVRELANNPLLLTLLCLEFGDSGDFPPNRSELYYRAIHTLLRKWDAKRGVVRDEVYKKLSVKHKEDLLSQLGWTTFERNEYFFKQRDIEEDISKYIRNLPEAKDDSEALRVDSEVVLKSIEAQHGLLVERAKNIYSFSHLTFQEYFTAREIKEKSTFQDLAKHITEKRWREVFLLTSGMMREADNLMKSMKKECDTILSIDEKLQKFLTWVEEKSKSVKARYKPAAVRAFYFALARDLDRDLARDLARDLDRDLALDRDRDRALVRDLALALDLDLDLDLAYARVLVRVHPPDLFRARALARALDLALARAQDLNPELAQSLQQLLDQLLDSKAKDRAAYEQWCKENFQGWTEQFRTAMIEHRNIGHDWQFSDEQEELLQQYYDANKLLVDCLNSDCYVSREVRQEIEDTLLLPAQGIPYKSN
jgi:predicted NACHT family NTPase